MARLPDLPKLDARALFWWGIALAAFGVAWNGFLSEYASGVGLEALLGVSMSWLFLSAGFLLGQLGIVIVAVAFGVRSISDDGDRGAAVSQASNGRRFLTALPSPPRLDARAIFWSGIGLIAVGIACGEFFTTLAPRLGIQVLYEHLASRLLLDAISTSSVLGITLVAVAFGVRSLSRESVRSLPRDAEHEAAVSDG